jgi:RNA polymerase sigma factor (sigma-70 family)
MALRADDVDLCRDRDLVLCAQSGDDDAFEDLYRRYFARLYRFCLRRVGDPHEAEELTQEAFARAYRALPRLEGERRFYPWLSVIASRLCVDAFRRRSRTEPAPVIDLGALEAGEEQVDDAADIALLGRALDRLTPRHRHVLQLREQEGWSYQHIAQHYDVTLGTVEALLHRARKALRREFEVLAGGDARRAAGLPVLGWLARRVHRARTRLAGWEAAWTPMVGNAVAAGVVAIGAAVGGAAPAPTTITMVPAAAVHEAPAPPIPDAPAVVERARPAAAGAAAAPPAAAAPSTTGSSRYEPAWVVPEVLVSDREAKDRAGSQPTGHNDDEAGMGIDPEEILVDTARTIDAIGEEFEEKR